MSKKLKSFMLGFVVLAVISMLGGCTSAGPYVTNISSDGQGNLIVEKNTARFNSFTGTVSSGNNPTTRKIQIIPADKLEKIENLDHIN